MIDDDAILASAAEAIVEERTGRALADATAFTETEAPDGPGGVG